MYKKGEKVYYDNYGEVFIAKIVAVGEKKYRVDCWVGNRTYTEIYYIVEYEANIYHNGQVTTRGALHRRKVSGDNKLTKYE